MVMAGSSACDARGQAIAPLATTVDSRWGVMAVIPFLVTGLVVLA
jgi:hypothetical protein